MTDIRVNSELLDYLIPEFSGKSVSGKVQILVSLKNPENGPFSGEIQKMAHFLEKSRKWTDFLSNARNFLAWGLLMQSQLRNTWNSITKNNRPQQGHKLEKDGLNN
jgi:hypothetical protein